MRRDYGRPPSSGPKFPESCPRRHCGNDDRGHRWVLPVAFLYIAQKAIAHSCEEYAGNARVDPHNEEAERPKQRRQHRPHHKSSGQRWTVVRPTKAATAVAEKVAWTSTRRRCQEPASAAIHGEVEEHHQRSDYVEEWFEFIATATGHLVAAAQFSPKLEKGTAGENTEREAKYKGMAVRSTKLWQCVLEASRALIAGMRDSGALVLPTFAS